MHELSIATSIIDIALSEMQKSGGNSISELELEIGVLAGIEYNSFDFALSGLLENMGFHSAKVIVHKPGGKATCLDCGTEFPLVSFVSECPSCKSTRYSITRGRELRLKSIIVE